MKVGIQNMKQEHCIIRGDRSGVFFGKIGRREGREVEIQECRRLWYWAGAASLSQLALEGVKRPGDCKFTVTVPSLTILDCIEMIPCSEEAASNIKDVATWKR